MSVSGAERTADLRTRRTILVVLVLLLPACVFHSKEYVSEIALEGKNYRGTKGDLGGFYIDDEPLIKIRTGCRRTTSLGQTMSVLIPFPVTDEAAPHASIASEQFSLVLSHGQHESVDLSTAEITVRVSNVAHPLRLAGKKRLYSHVNYEYETNLHCGDIKDGLLTIRLDADKVRTYGVQFDEGVRREIKYQPYFTT